MIQHISLGDSRGRVCRALDFRKGDDKEINKNSADSSIRKVLRGSLRACDSVGPNVSFP